MRTNSITSLIESEYANHLNTLYMKFNGQEIASLDTLTYDKQLSFIWADP